MYSALQVLAVKVGTDETRGLEFGKAMNVLKFVSVLGWAE